MAAVWINLNNETPAPSAGMENVEFRFVDVPGGAPGGATLRNVSAQITPGEPPKIMIDQTPVSWDWHIAFDTSIEMHISFD
jgi:hypothetical protein